MMFLPACSAGLGSGAVIYRSQNFAASFLGILDRSEGEGWVGWGRG